MPLSFILLIFVFINGAAANVELNEMEETTGTSIRQQIVETALKYKGVPYVWGGASPSGFDSSGIIYYVFTKNGIDIPRVSFDIYEAGDSISKNELLPGDLVFFEGSRPGPSHGVIYIGDGEFVHSPSTGNTVSIGDFDNSYYSKRSYGAVRYIDTVNVTVFVNDEKIDFPKQNPFIDETNRTIVPIRFVSEALGSEVEWLPNRGEGAVKIKVNNTKLKIKIGSRTHKLNGATKEMDTTASILDGRTMVPLRFISEGMGAEVEWDGRERAVHINGKAIDK